VPFSSASPSFASSSSGASPARRSPSAAGDDDDAAAGDLGPPPPRVLPSGQWCLSAALGTRIGEYVGCTATVYGADSDRWNLAGRSSAGYGDDYTDNWARLAVVLTDHTWTRDLFVGTPVCGPEVVCGTTMTGTELRTIRRAFRKYRPGHCIGLDLVIVYDGTAPADVLVDHTYPAGTYDIHMFPLGPRRLVGYLHHGAYAGAAICGEEVA
jgi:hypothetical protein